MADHRPAEPHGALQEVFDDVFLVTGTFHFAPLLGIGRNMVVVRQGKELVVLASMRLSPEGEKELDKLGKVTHVVRVGGFHGADDPYYRDRYSPTFWMPPRIDFDGAKTLGKDGSPLDGAKVFEFEKGKMGEVALVLDRDGGVLVTSDSYQNWASFDGCTAVGKLMMRVMGFGPSVVGGPWVKQQGMQISADFKRLLELDFVHAIPGHGAVVHKDAKAGVKSAFEKRFRA